MKTSTFYKELEYLLAESTGADRANWAVYIVKHKIDLQQLAELLHHDTKTAMRFSWLLSDIGMADSATLKNALPFLFTRAENINTFNFKQSFATYWQIVGVPEEQEALAIDLLFGWLISSDVNDTTKSRALKALVVLTDKHPELKHELNACLRDQLDKNGISFRKLATKHLQ